MDKELRKGLTIDEYLELIKEDKNLNMAYISLSQYMHLLENQLEEKDRVIDEAINYIKEQMCFYDDGEYSGYDCEIDGLKLLEILESGKNENSNN